MAQQKIVIHEPDRSRAHQIAAALEDLFEPLPQALTLFEHRPDGAADMVWRIEAYYDDMPAIAALERQIEACAGGPLPVIVLDDVPDLNWVQISQAALPPVYAGRFIVHGSHDCGRIPHGPNSIIIDAGEAFGTAHHATTFGCLTALDQLTRLQQFGRVLDLGCGSGVLAIAVARANPRAKLIATDMDHQSVLVARENMRVNGLAARIPVVQAAGLASPKLRGIEKFDLIIANILAGPLIDLSGDVSRALKTGATLVLSGILNPQAASVIAAYRAQGCHLVSHTRITGWSTLVLKRND
jgi:ribosomal protein L11 methyltransferase